MPGRVRRDESARRTQAERRAATETALLDAATELVVSTGVRSLTLAAVGERAGYSRGIVTHHFGSKRGLVEALARNAQTGFVTDLEGQRPGLERLLALIGGYVLNLEGKSPAWRAFILLWAEAATSPELRPILQERDRQFRSELSDEIRIGVDAGEIRADVDPTATAVALLGQLRGIGLQLLIDRDGIELSALVPKVPDDWHRALTS